MHSKQTHVVSALKWLTLGLGVLCSVLIIVAFYEESQELEGRLIPAHRRGITPWKTITAEDIEYGASVPPNTNVILHIPSTIESIPRKVLFGRSGENTRYWGYCFPEDIHAALKQRRKGFPGRLFLSEAEREVREQQLRQRLRGRFSVYRNLNEHSLNERENVQGRIRHQVEIFEGGITCYIMAQRPLPIGLDSDGDGVNNILEREWNSDPEREDTDEDGISDANEIFGLGTDPKLRDTDGDGILDGLEDANRNGQIEMGETNPKKRDSDRDGLCDGLCLEGQNGSQLRGEDVNLNGKVDGGETDPRKQDSDGDGVLDEQEYFNCVLNTGDPCKYSGFSL